MYHFFPAVNLRYIWRSSNFCVPRIRGVYSLTFFSLSLGCWPSCATKTNLSERLWHLIWWSFAEWGRWCWNRKTFTTYWYQPASVIDLRYNEQNSAVRSTRVRIFFSKSPLVFQLTGVVLRVNFRSSSLLVSRGIGNWYKYKRQKCGDRLNKEGDICLDRHSR